jgi:hypothetical protein
MPELATMSPERSSRDPRIQQGAYVTDGRSLYEVRGVRRGQASMGFSAVRVILEDCRDLSSVEFLIDKIRQFRLVRGAPVARCPDLLEEIAW